MRSVSTRGTRATKKAVACDSSSLPANYFYKNGRRIQVGDCALFKSAQDFPHLIGIIRQLSSYKEGNLNVCVNKLYRPVELKLDKGNLLKAEPNEVFFSFDEREISSASLLHPCKVAFLPKGADLPLGTSSFVCRRVFEADSKRLKWLTDRFDERQEEVDLLLYKTQLEMHATVQSGGRSPKPINGPTPSQLKSGSDNVQSGASLPSQAKGKKRERVDQGSEPIKRERVLKADDGDTSQCKSESVLKLEISRITEKGGLVNSGGVEKLVQLMQPNRVEKLELVGKSMFAGVIAATENFDCLSRFVQLKGLPVLDQWLQDIHKGKLGGGSPKDGDKSIEEFLFILLRALDKLPVNLQALQMCNIGKSVNHLRTYKNSEIQKKARSLVDTWKKRVEAEMNVIDTKSGSNQAVSWASKSRLPEGSSAAIKGSAQLSSATKVASSKPVQTEVSTKLATLSPASVRDGEPRSVVGSNPDLPSTTIRDERSCSSSQSHNSQSCSTDHAKTTGLSAKEDARSSTAGSICVNRVSSGSSRPRRSISGRPGSAPSESPRETGLSRTSTLPINLSSGKLSQSGLTCEKVSNIPTVECSNSHKLIVKIPNKGRNPAQNASVGPVEGPTVMHSRSSSPVLSGKNDQSDPDSKGKADVKTESWESNDFKEILTASDEGDGSPDELMKSEKVHDVSFSSINALVESCAKYSQANTTESGGDEGGMNLLASVAAGEMSRSSPDGSSGRTSNIQGESIKGDDCKSSAPDGNNHHVQEQYQSEDGLHGSRKQGNPSSAIAEQAKEEETLASSKLVVSDETKDAAAIDTSPVNPASKVLADKGKQSEEKADTKIELSKLNENSLQMDDNVDSVAKEASSNALLDAPIVNKADVKEACKSSLKSDGAEGCNVPKEDFLSKSVDKLDGVKLEVKEIENQRSTCKEKDESKESESLATHAAAETLHLNKKPKFDLNEGFSPDDAKVGDPMNLENSGYPVSGRIVNPLPFPVAPKACGLPAPITVAAAAKGPYIPPLDLLRSKRELGWKGSAATSAFRPAEPRKALETPPVVAKTPDAAVTKKNRPVLDFDLNVADEFVDDVGSRNSPQETSSLSAHATTIHDFSQKRALVAPPSLGFPVGLDLDLNRVDEPADTWLGSSTSAPGMAVPFFPAKSSSLGGYPISESKKGFDLNDGPVLDEASEPSLHNTQNRSNVQSQPFFTSQAGTLSPWFPAGTAFPPVAIPSILTERGDQPFPVGPPRILGPPSGPVPFSPELYRGSVLTSSPAVPFPSFQYPVFPFGIPSASLSGVSTAYTDPLSNGRITFPPNSQMLAGPPSSVASHFPRPYLVSVQDGSNNSKWARQGLDLNAGPGNVEMEAKDESSTLLSRQHSVAGSVAHADEQGKMFQQMTGGAFKRKENPENFRYKQQSSWQ